MPDPVTGLVAGGTIVTGYMASKDAAAASSEAAGYQYAASMAGIKETRRQFDKVQELLKPWVTAGGRATGEQMNLLGLEGAENQELALDRILTSPMYEELMKQGEEGILANASATGGLRGGNVQEALARFRPTLLNSLIDQQYQRLGGLSNLGQASAAQTGAAATGAGVQISNLIGEAGAAQAGGALARGQYAADMWGDVNETIGIIAGGL